MRHLRAVGEKADVVGHRSSEQLVVLHDHADHRAPARRAQARQRLAVDQQFAFGGRQQARQDLEQRRLAAPDAPTIATVSPGSILKLTRSSTQGSVSL